MDEGLLSRGTEGVEISATTSYAALPPGHTEQPTAKSWRACAVLAVSVLLSMSTWLSASVVLPYLEAYFRIDEDDAPLLTISVQLGFVVCAVAQAIVQLPDRCNCRRLMCAGGLVACVANLAMLACRAFWHALVARFFTGVAMALIYPPSTKAMPGAGLWESRRGFVLLTVVTTGLTLVGAVMPVALLGDGPFPFPASTKFRASNLLKIARNGPGMLVIAAYCGHNWELYGAWSSIPSFFAAGVFGARAAAVLAFLAITMGGVAAVVLGQCGDAYGRAKFCVACSLVSCACDVAVGLCGAAAPKAATAALVLVWGFFLVPDSPQYSTLITELFEPELVGTALVLTQALGYVCTMPSIYLIPKLAEVPGVGGAGPSRPSRRAPPSRSPACSGSTRASGAKAGWRCRPRR
ncbi:hypothetical protein JL722_10710 [Aureococcus anophagefferens]|nr:hypothetical protein JL722_10710 [Aureococcus anophagefferens]